MAKDDGLKQFFAGLFFLLGIGLIAGVIYFIGVQKGFTQPQFDVVVIFDKVGGLTEGAPVRLSGVTVGTVKAIDFLNEEVMGRSIKVTLDILKKHEVPVQKSTKVVVQTEGVLGAKYVEISHEPGQPVLDLSKPILGEPMLDVYDLAEVLQDTATSFNASMHGINTMMLELKYISRKSKRVLDRIEQRVIDGNLFKVF
ncbi:MAG: MCE family protein [Candidatus Omnitrophica bacterium]|nr:MCE family protein [Candidatus Omnitrophota bacterium]